MVDKEKAAFRRETRRNLRKGARENNTLMHVAREALNEKQAQEKAVKRMAAARRAVAEAPNDETRAEFRTAKKAIEAFGEGLEAVDHDMAEKFHWDQRPPNEKAQLPELNPYSKK